MALALRTRRQRTRKREDPHSCLCDVVHDAPRGGDSGCAMCCDGTANCMSLCCEAGGFVASDQGNGGNPVRPAHCSGPLSMSPVTSRVLSSSVQVSCVCEVGLTRALRVDSANELPGTTHGLAAERRLGFTADKQLSRELPGGRLVLATPEVEPGGVVGWRRDIQVIRPSLRVAASNIL